MGLFDLARQQVEGLPDILIQQFLFVGLVEVQGLLFELRDHVDVLDGAGDGH